MANRTLGQRTKFSHTEMRTAGFLMLVLVSNRKSNNTTFVSAHRYNDHMRRQKLSVTVSLYGN
jgi:hypothetical protein